MILVRLLLAALLAAAPEPSAGPEVDAVAVLRAWDERRSAAWATGDMHALRDLYTRRSAAGRADAAMLSAWVARGLRVEDLRVQLLAVRVLARSDGRLTLRVTDRVAAATAVGDAVRVALPRDRASTRVVVLRRVAGEWRVATVS